MSIHWYVAPTPPGNLDSVHRYFAGALSPGRARDYVYRVLGDRTLVCARAKFRHLREIARAEQEDLPAGGLLQGLVCPRRVIESERDIAVWAVKAGRRSGFSAHGDIEVRMNGLVRAHADHGRPIGVPVWSVRFGYRVRDPAKFMEFLATGSGRLKAFGVGLFIPDFVFDALKKEVA
jgi:hypothetical protein